MTRRKLFSTARPSGFTLVELLVTVAIVAVLAALAVPWTVQAIRKGRQAATSSNLRQIGIAMIAYAGDHEGTLPGPACAAVYNYGRATTQDADTPHLGAYLAPYLSPATATDQKNCVVSVLKCPALSGQAQNDPLCANWVKIDYASTSPDNIFGRALSGSGLTMTAARQEPIQPRRLGALTSTQRRTSILCTADLQMWSNASYARELPAQGVFDGKRLWLFLDGGQALSDANAAWLR